MPGPMFFLSRADIDFALAAGETNEERFAALHERYPTVDRKVLQDALLAFVLESAEGEQET